MLVTRGVMLLLLWPFLGRIGPKVHWRSLTVIFWGGLRGAVALSLAVRGNSGGKIRKYFPQSVSRNVLKLGKN